MDDSARQRLIDTLPKLRKRIQKIQNRKENIGEQNTKAALIDPLLSALGWEVEDIDEVSREYKRKPQDNPVDYALFMLRSPRLFVEAKDLGKDLSDRKWISQILGYATVVGVEWCVLTNGDEYRLKPLVKVIAERDVRRNDSLFAGFDGFFDLGFHDSPALPADVAPFS